MFVPPSPQGHAPLPRWRTAPGLMAAAVVQCSAGATPRPRGQPQTPRRPQWPKALRAAQGGAGGGGGPCINRKGSTIKI